MHPAVERRFQGGTAGTTLPSRMPLKLHRPAVCIKILTGLSISARSRSFKMRCFMSFPNYSLHETWRGSRRNMSVKPLAEARAHRRAAHTRLSGEPPQLRVLPRGRHLKQSMRYEARTLARAPGSARRASLSKSEIKSHRGRCGHLQPSMLPKSAICRPASRMRDRRFRRLRRTICLSVFTWTASKNASIGERSAAMAVMAAG